MDDQKNSSDALASAKQEIERLRGEIAVSKKALADLSHEMKTPLNAVIGFAQTMKAETFGPIGTPRYKEYAAHIEESGGHLLDLVTTIIDLSKIDAGKRSLKIVEADPAVIASQSLDMVRHAIEGSQLSLTADIEANLPKAWLEPKALRQILVNLLSNAVKFTSDGSIGLKVFRAGASIIFVVSDTGIGMSKADLKVVGRRFSDAQADGVRGVQGSGLGLALAQELAVLHDGVLSLESAPGEGLCATVELPIGGPVARRRKFERPQPDVQSQLDLIEAYRQERKVNNQNAA